MTINQIVSEMEKKLEEYTVSKEAYKLNDTGADYVFIYDLKNFVMKDFTRKLIESLAEEIIPMNFEYCDSCQALGVENFGGWCSICKDALNANRRYNQQRLKVKEIIQDLH